MKPCGNAFAPAAGPSITNKRLQVSSHCMKHSCNLAAKWQGCVQTPCHHIPAAEEEVTAAGHALVVQLANALD